MRCLRLVYRYDQFEPINRLPTRRRQREVDAHHPVVVPGAPHTPLKRTRDDGSPRHGLVVSRLLKRKRPRRHRHVLSADAGLPPHRGGQKRRPLGLDLVPEARVAHRVQPEHRPHFVPVDPDGLERRVHLGAPSELGVLPLESRPPELPDDLVGGNVLTRSLQRDLVLALEWWQLEGQLLPAIVERIETKGIYNFSGLRADHPGELVEHRISRQVAHVGQDAHSAAVRVVGELEVDRRYHGLRHRPLPRARGLPAHRAVEEGCPAAGRGDARNKLEPPRRHVGRLD